MKKKKIQPELTDIGNWKQEMTVLEMALLRNRFSENIIKWELKLRKPKSEKVEKKSYLPYLKGTTDKMDQQYFTERKNEERSGKSRSLRNTVPKPELPGKKQEIRIN